MLSYLTVLHLKKKIDYFLRAIYWQGLYDLQIAGSSLDYLDEDETVSCHLE